jgi:hypothetical protein
VTRRAWLQISVIAMFSWTRTLLSRAKRSWLDIVNDFIFFTQFHDIWRLS